MALSSTIKNQGISVASPGSIQRATSDTALNYANSFTNIDHTNSISAAIDARENTKYAKILFDVKNYYETTRRKQDKPATRRSKLTDCTFLSKDATLLYFNQKLVQASYKGADPAKAGNLVRSLFNNTALMEEFRISTVGKKYHLVPRTFTDTDDNKLKALRDIFRQMKVVYEHHRLPFTGQFADYSTEDMKTPSDVCEALTALWNAKKFKPDHTRFDQQLRRDVIVYKLQPTSARLVIRSHGQKLNEYCELLTNTTNRHSIIVEKQQNEAVLNNQKTINNLEAPSPARGLVRASSLPIITIRHSDRDSTTPPVTSKSSTERGHLVDSIPSEQQAGQRPENTENAVTTPAQTSPLRQNQIITIADVHLNPDETAAHPVHPTSSALLKTAENTDRTTPETHTASAAKNPDYLKKYWQFFQEATDAISQLPAPTKWEKVKTLFGFGRNLALDQSRQAINPMKRWDELFGYTINTIRKNGTERNENEDQIEEKIAVFKAELSARHRETLEANAKYFPHPRPKSSYIGKRLKEQLLPVTIPRSLLAGGITAAAAVGLAIGLSATAALTLAFLWPAAVAGGTVFLLFMALQAITQFGRAENEHEGAVALHKEYNAIMAKLLQAQTQ